MALNQRGKAVELVRHLRFAGVAIARLYLDRSLPRST